MKTNNYKKYIFITILLMLLSINARAEEATFKKCIDGDTADLVINGKTKKVRFLAVDAPEIKHGNKKADPYGEDAKLFTCYALKTAKKINLEYDKNSDKTDKYDRHLVWVFVDDKLLQAMLVKKGYAKVAYLYGDYKYTDQLKKYEAQAKKEKINMWSDYKIDYIHYLLIFGICIIVLIVCIVDKSYRKKTVRKIKNKAKRKLDKEVDKLFR